MTACANPDCTAPAVRRRLCRRHYDAVLSAGRRLSATAPRPTPTSARVEDALWLLECGEYPERIAQRCGFSSIYALDIALRRNGTPSAAVQAAAQAAARAARAEEAA